MITCHPHPDRRPFDHDPANPCKHVIQSTAFQARFARVTEVDLFGALVRYCASKRGGVIGQTELILSDDNGDPHRFYFETFYNRYDALTLGVYVGPERVAVAVGL